MLTVSEISESNATLEQCHRTPGKINRTYSSGHKIVDKSHTHAHGVQETPMNVVGKLRSVYTLLLGKHC